MTSSSRGTQETGTISPRSVAVIIPAAGQAKRFRSGSNKIWAELGGRSVLERTLAAFEAHPQIGGIMLAANPDEQEQVRSMAAGCSKLLGVAAGGATRSESVRNALYALPAHIEIALVHDAARPLVSQALISRVLEAVLKTGAALPGLPVADTVKRVNAEGLIQATIPRTALLNGQEITGLTAVQTPQGARVDLLKKAYDRPRSSAEEPTDEASLLEALGVPISVVEGDPANLKITHPEDIARARALHAMLNEPSEFPEIRTGLGYDVHAFASPEAGRTLFLGGVPIPHDRGLDGHSDADVLLHALCDALLGAASLGDIGLLFPNTDPAYHNISSLKLLDEVGRRIREEGWQIVNLDATLVAEAPKVLPYRLEIQQKVAERLGIAPVRMSVKATTNEQMGFVGRKEGIACMAVATLRRS